MILHTSPLSGIATYKNQYVLTAGYDNQVILWDADNDKAIERGCHDHLANQCAFSPCGNFAASSSSDYSVRVWRIPEMKLAAVLNLHTDDVEGISFHPNKPLIATCSRDKSIHVYELDGTLVHAFTGHEADVISVEWKGDTDELVSSSDDGTIKTWSLTTKQMVECIDLGGIETDTIAISKSGKIYAGNDLGQIITINGHQKSYVEGHNAGIKRLVYDSIQQRLVSLSYDRQVKIWDCSGEVIQCIHSANLPNIVWPRSCAFLNNNTLVFVTFGSSYARYNINKAEWSLTHILDTHGNNAITEHDGKLYTVGDAGIVKQEEKVITQLPSLCNFLCTIGDRMITGGQTGEVFDAKTGEMIYQHRSPLNCAVAFTQGGQHFAVVGTYTGEGLLFTLIDNQLSYVKDLHLHENAIKGISANQHSLFSVCADGAVAFHDLSTFEQQYYDLHAHDMIANGCASDGVDTFVSVSRDLKLRIWEGKNALCVDTPSKNSIKCVAMSKCGNYVAIGNYVGYVGLYCLQSHTWLHWARHAGAGVSSIDCTLDNRFIASSYDGQSHIINIEEYNLAKVA